MNQNGNMAHKEHGSSDEDRVLSRAPRAPIAETRAATREFSALSPGMDGSGDAAFGANAVASFEANTNRYQFCSTRRRRLSQQAQPRSDAQVPGG